MILKSNISTTARVIGAGIGLVLIFFIFFPNYPVIQYEDGMYGCRGALKLNVREVAPWDDECTFQQKAPSCALVVVQYRVNGNVTLICRKAYQ